MNTPSEPGPGPDQREPSAAPEMPTRAPQVGTPAEGTTPAGRQSAFFTAPFKRVPRWARVVVPIAIVAGVIGGTALGFATRPAVSSTKEYAALNDELTAKITSEDATISKLRAWASDKDAQISTLQSAAAGVKTLQQQLADKEKTLASKEADLASREQKLSDATKQVAASQIKSGLHVVGGDVQPGTYTTTGPDGTNSVGCYYAWKTGTGSDASIKDNNIVKGAATVTLANGEVFESTSCTAWTKIG
ncbi:hypothetical protein GCM10023346_05290 [Arthrobacter gyeryongensis]|uniref:Uncharacterized protein n=1 Tax=Arthrobacter gyeryongensis TaxID=1650592 RepID=A0ABP9S1Q3_9MICC